MNKDFTNLKEFWNSAYRLTDKEKEEYLKGLKADDWKELVPSEKQLKALETLKDKKKVLDYGCGNGWASIALAKLGAKDITSVDISDNPIKQVEMFSDAFNVSDKITPKCVNTNWLKEIKDNSFDGIFTSNVLDVIPLEISDDIISDFARVITKDGLLIVSLNYYIRPVENKDRGITIKNDKYLFINGILRLSARSDDEWKEVFEKYFKVEKLEYFAWPGEEKETRRLFFLRK